MGGSLGDELLELWSEYERQESKEAVLVKDIDKLDMVLQVGDANR